MDRKDIYSYEIDGKLYINLTNKCTNNCEFCVRHKDTYEGYYLWMSKEPTVEDVINSIEDLDKYNEVVFCGYGEPTYRMDAITTLGRYFKEKGKIVRINTNGHGNRINGRDITSDLAKAVDIISISLNQSDEEKYDEICHPNFEKAFEELIDFASKCVEKCEETYLSVVAVEGVDVEKCKELAKKIGAKIKVREYIDIN